MEAEPLRAAQGCTLTPSYEPVPSKSGQSARVIKEAPAKPHQDF